MDINYLMPYAVMQSIVRNRERAQHRLQKLTDKTLPFFLTTFERLFAI